MKKLFLGLLFPLIWTFIAEPANAQVQDQQYVDSLTQVAFGKAADSTKVNTFKHIQRYYFNIGLYDSSLKYGLISLPIALKLKNQASIGRNYYNIGLVYSNLARYDSAAYYLDSAMLTAKKIKDTILEVGCLNALALSSRYQSDYSTAVEYLFKASTLLSKTNTKAFINYLPHIYNNIGNNLVEEKQFEKAIFYCKKGLQFTDYPEEDRYRILFFLDIANANLNMQKYSEAKIYLDSANIEHKHMDNVLIKILVANNWGEYYRLTNKPDSALNAYFTAYNLCDSIGNIYNKCGNADNIAKIFFRKGNLQEAEKYALEAVALSKPILNYSVLSKSYEVLKKVAVKRNQYQKALDLAELSALYADSASNVATRKIALSLESRYQHQKREKELTALKMENAERELMVLKRNRMLLVGGITAVALLLVFWLLYRNSKHQQVIAEKEKQVQQQQILFLEKQQQVVSMQSMINGQEVERTRISKDLHDGLGGLFSTIKMHFSTLQHDNESLKTNPLFVKSLEMANTAAEEVRRIAHNMMPEVLVKMGLVQAVQEMCYSISAGKLLTIKLQAYGMEKRFAPSTEIMIFRIIQELVNNIIKHAQASEALIQFNRMENQLSITVEDNGRGFNQKETTTEPHAGLDSVKSRVHYLNGTISIDSGREIGTTVTMDFLIQQE